MKNGLLFPGTIFFSSKAQGGAGLRVWRMMNHALGAKLVWNIYNDLSKLWVHIVRVKYLDSTKDGGILKIRNPPKGSAVWNFILDCRNVIKDHISWNIGSSRKALFWKDSWNGFALVLSEDKYRHLSRIMTAIGVIRCLTMWSLRSLVWVLFGLGEI